MERRKPGMELSLYLAGYASMRSKHHSTCLFTAIDTFETFFDARIDLWERRLKKQGKLVVDGTRDALRRRGIDRNIDRELARLKEKVSIPLSEDAPH